MMLKYFIIHSPLWILALMSNLTAAFDSIPPAYMNSTNTHRVEQMNIFENSFARIVGGTVAPPKMYSWFSRIIKNGRTWCGSSLVSSEFVLTAAHCIKSDEQNVKVEIGALCTASSDNCGEKSEVFNVKEIIIHPQWDNLWWTNDFALLRLDGISSIPPVKLDQGGISRTFKPNKKLFSCGFGSKNADGGGVYPTRLRHAELEYISQTACKNEVGEDLKQSMLCAKGRNQDTCSGDSGGPLYDNESKALVGVISWGYGCEAKYPGVYARVASAFPWIKKTTCDTNSASRPSFCGSANNAALDSCANSNQARLEIEVSADSYSEADNSFKVLMRKNGKFDVERVSVENLSNNQVVRMSRCLNKDKCYKFIMLDKFGDGICCGYGKGYYIITWDGKRVKRAPFKGGKTNKTPGFGNC